LSDARSVSLGDGLGLKSFYKFASRDSQEAQRLFRRAVALDPFDSGVKKGRFRGFLLALGGKFPRRNIFSSDPEQTCRGYEVSVKGQDAPEQPLSMRLQRPAAMDVRTPCMVSSSGYQCGHNHRVGLLIVIGIV
jgi:hypothetical protein